MLVLKWILTQVPVKIKMMTSFCQVDSSDKMCCYWNIGNLYSTFSIWCNVFDKHEQVNVEYGPENFHFIRSKSRGTLILQVLVEKSKYLSTIMHWLAPSPSLLVQIFVLVIAPISSVYRLPWCGSRINVMETASVLVLI